MGDLYWLTDEPMAPLEPYFPKSHGKPRVDDGQVLSGIIFVNRNGLRWRDAPPVNGPHNPQQSLEAVERGRRLHPNAGGAVWRPGRTAHSHDRLDLSEGTPHGFGPPGKKGGLGRRRKQTSQTAVLSQTGHEPDRSAKAYSRAI